MAPTKSPACIVAVRRVFEFLTLVDVDITVFSNVTACGLVDKSQVSKKLTFCIFRIQETIYCNFRRDRIFLGNVGGP